MKIKFIFLFILLQAAHFVTRAQDAGIKDNIKSVPVSKNKKQDKPLSANLSFFNHSISVPFHKMINKSLHPGVQAGIERRYFETHKSKLFQTLNLGMFYNEYNGTGFYLNTELAYRYTSKYNIYAETMAGFGYLRIYHPVDIYQLTSMGTYEKVRDKGFSSPIISFAFGLGYAIKSSSAYSFAPFIRYECLIQTHYNSDMNVLPHAALHIGVHINKKRKK
jgi:hypothetical protein